MYRCTDCGLTTRDDGDTVDPDVVEDVLKILSFYTKSNTDAVWHHALEVDPFELQKLRRKQKTYLARYGRMGHPNVWDNEEIIELRAFVEETSDMLKSENTVSRESEDR